MIPSGPETKRAVERATDANGVMYDYVDAKLRKVPAWSASDVRIRAFYYAMKNDGLEPLAQAIQAMPGCRSVEILRDHPTLRPQVVALFGET